jgi:hypothetical protein
MNTESDSPRDFPDLIKLPEKPESILALALAVIERHQSEGVRSPLRNQIIADLYYKTTLAKAKHNEGVKYQKLMEEAFTERNVIVGSNAGNVPHSNTITDLLSDLARVLIEHDTTQLARWGFTLK